MYDANRHPGSTPWEPRHQHRGRGRRGGQWGGPPPWLAEMFGPQAGGPYGGRGAGPRVRRGDVRTAILDVLAEAEEPLNGYQVIQQIADRTDDAWRPSPGSVYPTIAQLQDEGLVEDAPTGRKALQLTDEGRTWVGEHADEVASVWAPFEEHQQHHAEHEDLRQVIKQTVAAIVQVATQGTPEQRRRAVEILADARRSLYGLLAEPEEGDE